MEAILPMATRTLPVLTEYQYYAVAIPTRYAVSRYTLFLALVDFHAFKRAAPAWDLPGALQQHVSTALTKAASSAKAASSELQGEIKQAG